VIAVVAAAAHLLFASREALGWDLAFVQAAAPGWIAGDPHAAARHVAWAEPLAFNVATYNLMLAVGLAWTGWSALREPPLGSRLGVFFGLWLLAAAAAARLTGVDAAFVAQGFLGVVLLAGAAMARG
jgi:uncharacterized membrane protein